MSADPLPTAPTPTLGVHAPPEPPGGRGPLLSGVCAVCHARRRLLARAADNGDGGPRLPPLADAAIAAVARCRKLTAREIEVLTLVCAGLKNAAIAAVLRLSLATVRLHIKRLHKKTNTCDKVELILDLWHCCAAAPGAQSQPHANDSGTEIDQRYRKR